MNLRLLAPALAAAALLAACSSNSGGTGTIVASTLVPPPTPTPVITAAPASTAVAIQYSRPAGQFYAAYTGDKRPALDAIAVGSTYSLSTRTITLIATMNGPLTAGAPNYYVWGFNRGAATNAPFVGEPNAKFDSVLSATVNPDGTATAAINLIGSTVSPPPVAPPVVTVNGATLRITFSADALPQTGATTPNLYVWNLWPRSGVGGAAAAQIASFAPENDVLPFILAP